jgi:hypothetical protein
MRLILKLLAAPFALAFTIAAAFFSFILSVSGVIFGIVSTLVSIVSAALFVTGQSAGGVAFLVIAFLVSPFGLPALGRWIVKGLDGMGSGLMSFLRS